MYVCVCVCPVTLSDDEDKQEKALSQVYDSLPDGHSPLEILRKKQERRRIGQTLYITTLLFKWLNETSVFNKMSNFNVKCSIFMAL